LVILYAGMKLHFSIHSKGAKDAKKTTLLWRLISLNIFFAIFAVNKNLSH
jgi:hypothetical protein